MTAAPALSATVSPRAGGAVGGRVRPSGGEADSDDVYLHPGEIWFGSAPARVRTLLGSCVALTLWHPERRMGGMCHFMLPSRGIPDRDAADARFGDEAFALLTREIARHGVAVAECEAKLFGAGRMFASTGRDGDVAQRNVAQARRMAAAHGLNLRGEHLGGVGHRLVVLELATGYVWLRHTPLTLPAPLPAAAA